MINNSWGETPINDEPIEPIENEVSFDIEKIGTYAIKRHSGRLPPEYQELEYIQSSGSQYINCGYSYNTGDTVKLTIAEVFSGSSLVTASNENKGAGACGSYNLADSLDIGLRLSNTSGFYYYAPFFCLTDSHGKLYRGTLTSIYEETVTSEFVSGSSTLTNLQYSLVDTATNTEIDSYSYENKSFTTTKSVMYLGKSNNYEYPFRGAKKFYGYKHWRNGELVTDLVPAKRVSDGYIGMYNLATSTFHTNVGSGSFTAGPIV